MKYGEKKSVLRDAKRREAIQVIEKIIAYCGHRPDIAITNIKNKRYVKPYEEIGIKVVYR